MQISNWIEASANVPHSAEAIAQKFSLPLWVAKILRVRMGNWHDQSPDAVAKFLKPSLKDLPDPFSLPDMRQAAECIADLLESGEPIGVFGDYDVDGTVGAALLRRFFRMLGVEPRVEQPDRQRDGYGLNKRAMEQFAEEGVQLLITVDCGISNYKEVQHANELGLTVIVCDHHEVPNEMPPAYAVLDHKRKDNQGPIHSLCGAGMAFYLCLAVRSVLRERGFFQEQKEPDLRDLLDLVAVATVADMVPLVEENRVLVSVGLEKLRRNPTLGLKELLTSAGVELEKVDPYHIGFVIGPRINASGRLGSASTALTLLSTDDPKIAQELAATLRDVNGDRQELQQEVFREAKALTEEFPNHAALVLANDDWHEGVIGIVASKIVEHTNKPTVMITFGTQTGVGKGSVRAGSLIDALAALTVCKEFLEGFGGHKAAAGLSIKKENLEAFREKFNAAVTRQMEELCGAGITRLPIEITVDSFVTGSDLTLDQVAALNRLAPFGMGNREPVLGILSVEVLDSQWLKERHLRLRLNAGENKKIEGIWFNAVEKLETVPSKVDAAFVPGVSNFRNRNAVELRIKDLRDSQYETSSKRAVLPETRVPTF